ncbi:MaoC family dehydratase [Christiangramia aquimixticola]|uniref:MaoC family dehydratase n=1 Tax=Christiangramia aquimixticola TaxID=1697558 RepID=UPI003AA8535C
MKDIKIEDFAVGQFASEVKTFTEKDVLDFSKLSGDKNPIHFDKEYARGTRFKKRIVQGPFVTSLFGGLLGSDLPGAGTIYMNQNTNFLAPVFIGDTVTATVEIKSIRKDKPVIKLRTYVKRDEELVIDGEATILFLKED